MSEKAIQVYESLVKSVNPNDRRASYHGNEILSSDERSSIIAELIAAGLIKDSILYGKTFFSCTVL